MREVNPVKVKFIDKDTMKVVEDYWNITVSVDELTGELTAWHIYENPEFDKKLEIKIKE